MMTSRISISSVFVMACLFSPLIASAADNKKDDDIKWVQLMTTNGGNGGKSRFKVSEDSKVKFEWDVQPTSGSTSFRITLSKKHERTGNYQTLATIFKTNSASKKHLIGNLKKGEYQLYLAVRRMKYTVTVYGASK